MTAGCKEILAAVEHMALPGVVEPNWSLEADLNMGNLAVVVDNFEGPELGVHREILGVVLQMVGLVVGHIGGLVGGHLGSLGVAVHMEILVPLVHLERLVAADKILGPVIEAQKVVLVEKSPVADYQK